MTPKGWHNVPAEKESMCKYLSICSGNGSRSVALMFIVLLRKGGEKEAEARLLRVGANLFDFKEQDSGSIYFTVQT